MKDIKENINITENNDTEEPTDTTENKKSEKVSKFFHKTANVSKTAVNNVKKSAKNLSEKAKSDFQARKIKKLNPVFPNQYTNESFKIPNLIMIVDDAQRRDIEVCKGAIGWLDKPNGTEVFYLYDEEVKNSGLTFLPTPTCDSIYYVDSFDRNRFIRLDSIFNRAHEEKLAELKNIAYSLGAKKCTIEICETTTESNSAQKNAEAGANVEIYGAHTNESIESSISTESSTQISGKITAEFEGSDKPKRPKLKWFKDDDNINRLIDMRCKEGNSIKTETLSLYGSSSGTMSSKTACTIDNAVKKIGAKSSVNMENYARKENSRKMIFSIEF